MIPVLSAKGLINVSPASISVQYLLEIGFKVKRFSTMDSDVVDSLEIYQISSLEMVSKPSVASSNT